MDRYICYVIWAMGMFVFVCAVILVALVGEGRTSYGMVSLPCGLLGCVVCLIVVVLRSYEQRIARLEERLPPEDGADQ